MSGIFVLLGIVALGLTISLGYVAFLWRTKGKFVESENVRLHYVEKGTGVPVILVHGFAINLGGNWFFPHVFQRLAKDYRVIALDNRGHGRSQKFYEAEAYGTQFVEDIVRLMDHLRIPKAHVIGYSMGGFIVLKLIEMYPDRLLSAAPCGAGWTPHPEKEIPFVEEVANSLERGDGFIPLLEWLEPRNKPKRKWLIRIMNILMCALFDQKALSAVLRSFPQLQVSEEALRKNNVPTLAVVGESDPLRPFAEQVAAVMNHVKLVIVPRADHGTALFGRTAMKSFRQFLKENTPKQYE